MAVDARLAHADTVDDGSCSIGGCTDPSSSEYDAGATFDDGSCSRRRQMGATRPSVAADEAAGVVARSVGGVRRRVNGVGCKDPAASTFDGSATSHDGALCSYEIHGCTDPTALNYLSSATKQHDETPCKFAVLGCTVAVGTLNYDSRATVYQLGSCVNAFRGCTDSTSATYAPSANLDDGSCKYEVRAAPGDARIVTGAGAAPPSEAPRSALCRYLAVRIPTRSTSIHLRL